MTAVERTNLQMCTGPTLVAYEAVHPHFLRMLEYWRSKAGRRPLPRRGDIDPFELKFCIADLLMFDVVDRQTDYLCSVCGTEAGTVIGRDLTGKRLSETGTETGHLDRVILAEAVWSRAPVHAKYVLSTSFVSQSWECLALPMSDDSGAVKKILVVFYPLTARQGKFAAVT